MRREHDQISLLALGDLEDTCFWLTHDHRYPRKYAAPLVDVGGQPLQVVPMRAHLRRRGRLRDDAQEDQLASGTIRHLLGQRRSGNRISVCVKRRQYTCEHRRASCPPIRLHPPRSACTSERLSARPGPTALAGMVSELVLPAGLAASPISDIPQNTVNALA